MYSTASLTFLIFSASSSEISTPNSSSKAMISSTWSSESAPRSSTNEASEVTSSASTPSCSTMIDLTLSSTDIGSSIHSGYLLCRCVLAQMPPEWRPCDIRFRPVKKIFSYEDAAALLPEVQRLTAAAVDEVDALANDVPKDEAQRIVAAWAESLMNMGIEVKGLWLIDFDNGSGYY